MKKIPMLEKFAAQSLVEYDGELIFSKEKFAELIVRECVTAMYKRGEAYAHPSAGFYQAKEFSETIMKHFGVE